MAISKSKKRYMFSLDRQATDKVKSLLAGVGAHPDALSMIINDYVKNISEDVIMIYKK
jgi:hypothetical protein